MNKLDERLRKKKLAKATRDRYRLAVQGKSEREIVTLLKEKLRSNASGGTILPLRAAAKHYLISEKGLHPDKVEELLPKVGSPPIEMPSDALTPHQLRGYYRLVTEHRDPAVQAVMALLPTTGLKTSEILGLQRRHVLHAPDRRWAFEVLPISTGKHRRSGRFAHLNAIEVERGWTLNPVEILAAYLSHVELSPDDLLFDVEPARLTRNLRIIGDKMGFKGGKEDSLNPARLRRTYAALLIQNGAKLDELQHRLGVRQIANVARYFKAAEDQATGDRRG